MCTNTVRASSGAGGRISPAITPDEPGAVDTSGAVNEDSTFGRLRDRGHGAPEPVGEPVEEEEVVTAAPFTRVVDVRQELVHLADAARVQQRDVDDLDGRLVRLVLVPQVDNSTDVVVGDGAPARLRQKRDVVGAHDDAEARLASVLERQAAQVADVAAALPAEGALRLQLRRARSH